jgi:hypothetical protein
VVCFFLGSTTLLDTELDQTVKISIAPCAWAHATGGRPSLPFQEDLDMIVLSDTDPDSDLESDEEVTIVSFGPAPGPGSSGPTKAIIPHDSDDIDVSDSELESDADADLEDVVVSLFHLSSGELVLSIF